MLLMTWAQAQFSGDSHIVETYVHGKIIQRIDFLPQYARNLEDMGRLPRKRITYSQVECMSPASNIILGVFSIKHLQYVRRWYPAE